MKTPELRLGNWIIVIDGFGQKNNRTVYKIEPKIIWFGKNSAITGKFKSIEGIPISEEWLLGFGFERIKNQAPEYRTYEMELPDGFSLKYQITERLKYSDTTFVMQGNGGYDDHGEMVLSDRIKHVHQLQNLYFALTGKELTIIP